MFVLFPQGEEHYFARTVEEAVEFGLYEAETNHNWWHSRINTHNPARVVWNSGVGRVEVPEGLRTVYDRVWAAKAPDLWVGARFENLDGGLSV